MNRNQKNQAGWGGIREGAGRPRGTYSKPRFADFVTPEDIQRLIQKALEMAENGDSAMMRHVLDHSLGRPTQPTDITSGGERLNTIQMSDGQYAALLNRAYREIGGKTIEEPAKELVEE